MAKRIREKALKVQENREKRPHASAMHVRIAPSKVMIVMNAVRGMTYDDAVGTLSNMPQKAAALVLKVLQSAGANAEHNMSLNKSDLKIAEIYADMGPSMKRYSIPGRGHPISQILKRTSHIHVVLDSAN